MLGVEVVVGVVVAVVGVVVVLCPGFLFSSSLPPSSLSRRVFVHVTSQRMENNLIPTHLVSLEAVCAEVRSKN